MALHQINRCTTSYDLNQASQIPMLSREESIEGGNCRGATMTPLQVACADGYTELVIALCLNPSVEVHRAGPDWFYRDPIRIAASENLIEIATILLDEGEADVQGGRGSTETNPLATAANRGHLEMVKFLVSRGADVNVLDGYGFTPLDEATFLYNQTDENLREMTDIVAFLKSKGALTGDQIMESRREEA